MKDQQFMLPVDAAFIEAIAKSIGRDRIYRTAASAISRVAGKSMSDDEIQERFDREFEYIWNGTSEADELARVDYREDARTAIRTINLLLLTTPPTED